MPQSRDAATFRDITAAIAARITTGPWGPGTLLPGEVELAAEFGVSRTTMNRALREVAEMGLVTRKRRAGTRVRMAPARQARFEMPLIRAEVEGTGTAYTYCLITREVAPAPAWLAARMRLTGSPPALHLTCLHLADARPFQLEDRWINLAALPQAETQDFNRSGPNEWLVATVPFSEVEISFQAVAADAQAVAHLGHAPGAPVFCVTRATWWQQQAITHVTFRHAAGYRMTTRY